MPEQLSSFPGLRKTRVEIAQRFREPFRVHQWFTNALPHDRIARIAFTNDFIA
jgi:hypothetical protein